MKLTEFRALIKEYRTRSEDTERTQGMTDAEFFAFDLLQRIQGELEARISYSGDRMEKLDVNSAKFNEFESVMDELQEIIEYMDFSVTGEDPEENDMLTHIEWVLHDE